MRLFRGTPVRARARNRAFSATFVIAFAGAVAGQALAGPEGAAKALFLLNKVTFTPSKVFTQAELDAFIAPYLHHQVSVTALFDIVEAVNLEYNKRGYVSALAFLPPQDIRGGEVTITFVEATIGTVSVAEKEGTASKTVIGAAGIVPGTLPTLALLEEASTSYNWWNRTQIAAGLQKGQTTGSTDLVYEIVNQPPDVSTSISLDNFGTENSGVFKFGYNRYIFGLAERDDMLSLGFTKSAEQIQSIPDPEDAVFSAYVEYDTIVGEKSNRLILNASANTSEVLEGDFADLIISGASVSFSARYLVPIQSSSTWALRSENEVFYSWGQSRVGDVWTFTEQVHFMPGLMFKFNVPENGISGNVTAKVKFAGLAEEGLSGAITETATILTTNADLSFRPGNGFIASVKASTQLANRGALPSKFQWSMGGPGSIRGYDSGEISGDQGYFASLTLGYSKPFDVEGKSWVGTFRGFFDHGYNQDEISQPTANMHFNSVGIGFDLRVPSGVSLTADVGWRVEEDNTSGAWTVRKDPKAWLTLNHTF